MPTKEELTELHEKCKWEMTTLNGQKGYKLIGANGNYIFMPAADRMFCGTLDYVDDGYYWSSSLNISENNYAWILHFEQDWYHACISGTERCLGLSVRPVCP